MRVALGSIFRNASAYVQRFYSQARELAAALDQRGDTLRLILVEGDSVDLTWRMLDHYAPANLAVERIKRNHGGPSFGSVITPQRMACMAYCQNGVIERVTADDDAFIYVESDLLWQPATMLRLLEDLNAVPLVAPLAMHHNGRFYDTWGFRKDGFSFGFFPPFHPDLDLVALTRLDSAGSCLVMWGEVARAARFQKADCIVGLCKDAAAKGYPTYLDPTVSVVHPPDGSETQIPGYTETVPTRCHCGGTQYRVHGDPGYAEALYECVACHAMVKGRLPSGVAS